MRIVHQLRYERSGQKISPGYASTDQALKFQCLPLYGICASRIFRYKLRHGLLCADNYNCVDNGHYSGNNAVNSKLFRREDARQSEIDSITRDEKVEFRGGDIDGAPARSLYNGIALFHFASIRASI